MDEFLGFFVVAIVMIVGYAMIGTFWPTVRTMIDVYLSPVIDSMKYAGVNIRKPDIHGPLEEIYYRNLLGICVFFSVAYNFHP